MLHGAGSLRPFDPRLQKRVHRPAVSTHLKAHLYTSIPSQWGLETNYANMYTHISQGPENDISEIWSSSPYRKKVFQNGQMVDQNVVERRFLG